MTAGSEVRTTVDDVIERARGLDLATKIKLLTGSAMFALHGEPSIGLQPMVFSDGPTGVRGAEFTGGRQVALFPKHAGGPFARQRACSR